MKNSNRSQHLAVVSIVLLCCPLRMALAAEHDVKTNSPESAGWSPAAAAHYLDGRAIWWESWPASQRDHKTVCVSCHTMLPYVLARTKLNESTGKQAEAEAHRKIVDSVRKRITLWDQVEPYYLDASSGPGKSRESRATEAVLNALVMAGTANDGGRLDADTRAAFEHAWALQLKTGPSAGAWDWQLFHLSPWENTESQYQGAAFMALALGLAPGNYVADQAIHDNVAQLRSFLQNHYPSQPLVNQMVLAWASGKVPGLISDTCKTDLVRALAKLQRTDGGWSLSSLGTWTRSDGTTEDSESDGYGTSIAVLALKQLPDSKPEMVQRGEGWLRSHQSQEGSWHASSLNKKRDPKSDVGLFMTDAATGYAVLALTSK